MRKTFVLVFKIDFEEKEDDPNMLIYDHHQHYLVA